VERVARRRGHPIRIRGLHPAPLRILLALQRHLLGSGLSPDGLEVLLTDTRVDPAEAAAALGIELTPLEVTIGCCLEDEEDP
jgi:hypothetical protein